MTTTVINIKDAPPDWETNPRYVYIGRAGHGMDGRWGNHFIMHDESERAQVMKQFIDWYHERYKNGNLYIHQLRGKILVCFCSPKLCHGDFLAAMADLVHE